MRWKAKIPFPRARDAYRARWERWFAWYPVQVEGEVVWLEVVRRRFAAGIWDYAPRTFAE